MRSLQALNGQKFLNENATRRPEALRGENIEITAALRATLAAEHPNANVDDLFIVNPMTTITSYPSLSSERLRALFERIDRTAALVASPFHDDDPSIPVGRVLPVVDDVAPAREPNIIAIPPNLSIDVCVAAGMDRETLRALGPLSQRELEDQYVDFIETRNRQQATIAEMRRVEDASVLSGKARERQQAEEEAAMWEAVRAGRERDRETARAQEAEAARWAALTPAEREAESQTIEQRDALFRHLFTEAAAENTEAAWIAARARAHDALAYWNRVGSEVAAGRTPLKPEEVEIQKNLWDQKIKLADTIATALNTDRPGWSSVVSRAWHKERTHAKKVFTKATDVWLNFSIAMRNFNNDRSEVSRNVRFVAVCEAAETAAKAIDAADATIKVAVDCSLDAIKHDQKILVLSTLLAPLNFFVFGASTASGNTPFWPLDFKQDPKNKRSILAFSGISSAADASRAIIADHPLFAAIAALNEANAISQNIGRISDSTWNEMIVWSLEEVQEIVSFVSTPAFADAATEFRAEQARRAPSAAASSESTQPDAATDL